MNLYKILPICSLLFVACSDENSDSIFNVESENFMSSSWIASSSSNSRNDVKVSSSELPSSATVALSSSSTLPTILSSSEQRGGDPSSSSLQTVILSSSEGSSNSSLSSSWIASNSSSSRNDVKVSSSSRNDESSSSESSSSATVIVSSSSEMVADPTKIFNIRVPDQKFLPCHDSIVSTNYREDWIDTVAQSDLICSFKYDGDSGFVYVQNNPVSCRLTVGLISYEVHKAEFFVNGSMREILDAKYHGGGNHRIFGLQFTYKGKVFKYDYSTMGMGGRPCQNMDCMKVFESDGKTVVQNGCGEDRSLPIVCRHAKENGTFDSFEDSFHVCKSGVFVD